VKLYDLTVMASSLQEPSVPDVLPVLLEQAGLCSSTGKLQFPRPPSSLLAFIHGLTAAASCELSKTVVLSVMLSLVEVDGVESRIISPACRQAGEISLSSI